MLVALACIAAVVLLPAAWGLSGCAVPYPVERYPATVQPSQPSYPYTGQMPLQRDYRRAPNEQLYEAKVLSARAVLMAGGQRCWIEREQVAAPRSTTNVPGALAGAVIGNLDDDVPAFVIGVQRDAAGFRLAGGAAREGAAGATRGIGCGYAIRRGLAGAGHGGSCQYKMRGMPREVRSR